MLGEMKGGVTTQRPDGYSGLHLSAEHGQLTVLAMLLRAGRSRDDIFPVTLHPICGSGAAGYCISIIRSLQSSVLCLESRKALFDIP